jgi:hypothetical protein
MRLIDADALKKAIIELDLDNTSHWTVIHKIDKAPTECEAYRSFCMAKQRPKGEWKRDNYGDVFCSNCGVECAYNVVF